MSSGVVETASGNPASQLIKLVRRGVSFSGNEKNCAFLNTHNQRFANISAVSGVGFPDDARAIGRVDWDADGDLDLWITNRNAPQVRFLRNEFQNEHGWISLRLEGRVSNRDAIGARVEVTTSEDPKRPLTRTVRCGDGYLTQSSKAIHVGLGQASKAHVRVTWPSGEKSEFRDLLANRRYMVVESEPAPRELKPSLSSHEMSPSVSKLPAESDAFSVSSIVKPHLPRLQYQTEKADRDLIEQKGTPILLVLWASWCPACQQELSVLAGAHDTLRKAGLKNRGLTRR